MKPKAVLCTPSLRGPTAAYMEALKRSVRPLRDAGYDVRAEQEIGCPYISEARAKLVRKALDAKADHIMFIDYDLSWEPEGLLELLATPGDVVAGTYRFKDDEERYMGVLEDGPHDRPLVRDDGCIKAQCVPAGFLKITPKVVERFMEVYPDLIYGPRYSPWVDLFNHGAHKGSWWGEDYAFCRRWRETGGEVWIVPDLNLTHHEGDKEFAGNFHRFMLRQPGGSESDNPQPIPRAA